MTLRLILPAVTRSERNDDLVARSGMGPSRGVAQMGAGAWCEKRLQPPFHIPGTIFVVPRSTTSDAPMATA
jgi:hypothetical protein